MRTQMAEALKKAEKEKEARVVASDPYGLIDLKELDEKAEDLTEAQKRVEEVATGEAKEQAKLAKFRVDVFPIMAGLVERREKARDISQKNFSMFEGNVSDLLLRKSVADVVKTAYVIAATHSQSGVLDPKVLLEDLKCRGLIKLARNGSISISVGRESYEIAFTPLEEKRVGVLQAIRERFGEVEEKERQAKIARKEELKALAGLSIHEVFSGKKGTFALNRPYEEVPRKDGSVWKYYPGILAGESDGQQVVIVGGTGGCEKMATELNAAGLALPIKALNDEGYWTKKDELKPLVGLHRTLWSIRRFAEAVGDSPEAMKAVEELCKTKGLVKHETFFNGTSDRAQKTLIVYDGVWKWYHAKGRSRERDRDGKMRDFDPMRNVAGILARDKDGAVYWSEVPAHLAKMFNGAIGIGANLESKKQERPRGVAMALYNWAKRKYSP